MSVQCEANHAFELRDVSRVRQVKICNMIETFYKTTHPEKGKSECYVLVLTRRAGNAQKSYAFMEEHGQWDDRTNLFLRRITSIATEDELTYHGALAMYDSAKQRLAQHGFVHSFVHDFRLQEPHMFHGSEVQEATA